MSDSARSLSDQIAYHRSLCDAATQARWYVKADRLTHRAQVIYDDASFDEGDGDCAVLVAATDEPMDKATDAAFIAAYSPDVVSALLDVAEAAQETLRDYDLIRPDINYTLPAEPLRDALTTLSRRMKEQP